jgi:hypothetical protein
MAVLMRAAGAGFVATTAVLIATAGVVLGEATGLLVRVTVGTPGWACRAAENNRQAAVPENRSRFIFID